MPYADPAKNRACRLRYKRSERGKQLARIRYLWNEYGLTPEAYDALLLKQDGRCAICLRIPKCFDVDHSHVTGAVRGLLCHGCNTAIGVLQDSAANLRRAAAYVEE